MTEYEFSLPSKHGEVKIIGRPVENWDWEKSGRELYDILGKLPSKTTDKLKEIIVAEELAENYTINDLKKLINGNLIKYEHALLKHPNDSKIDMSHTRLNKILGKAIKIRGDERILKGERENLKY